MWHCKKKKKTILSTLQWSLQITALLWTMMILVLLTIQQAIQVLDKYYGKIFI